MHALAAYGPGLPLKHALLTTDHVPHAIVTAVESAWGCAAYNHYGMTEMGLGAGVIVLPIVGITCARLTYCLRSSILLPDLLCRRARTGRLCSRP